MSNNCADNVHISIATTFVDEQSNPVESKYVFAYTITIRNDCDIAIKLLSRHWVITDANNKVEEVRGEGVIGLKPYFLPGQSFTYTSGAVLETPLGCMEGSYHMITDEGLEFNAPIPVFRLTSDITMH